MIKIKIIVHIVAISCFLLGCTMLHAIINDYQPQYYFFEILVNIITVLDFALIFLGIAFLLEFYMSFKQIEITN